MGPFDFLQAVLPGVPVQWLFLLLGVAGFALLPVVVILAKRQSEVRNAPISFDLDNVRVSLRDPLTSLANRAGFNVFLTRRLQGGARSALLLIDLDRFKSFNSAFGHRFGDEVLVAAVGRLRELLPDVTGLARLGGDEFAAILEAHAGRDEIESTSLKILRAMMAPLQVGNHTVQCSFSIGVALMPEHGTEADAVLRAAHSALDEVKKAGGGGFRMFDPQRLEAELQREKLKEDLRCAIVDGHILPYYQPIVDLRTRRVIGMEVLARWNHPTRGVISPELFVPMAEELAMTGQITKSLIRRVIRDARDWPNWLYFALNVSPGQLRELISLLRDPPVWPEGALDPTRMEIELTEAALTEDLDVAREVMGLLHAQGTRVVLDDFGIGYSSIFHLRELPFDRIKIDRSFVMNCGSDPRAQACVRAMLALGSSLGVEMVAEGIENLETADLLDKLGCRYGQGYLFSPAVPASGVYPVIKRLCVSAEQLVD